MKNFAGQVQLVLYPVALSDNPRSLAAAQAALCAGEQGKFWEMHHMLYEQQTRWSQLASPLPRISEFAKGIGIEVATLESCVKSERMRPILDANRAQARSLQVHSTPTVFVNAQRLIGPENDFIGTIQRELARVKRSAP